MNETKAVVAKEEKQLVIGKETIKRLRSKSVMKQIASPTGTSACSMCTP